MTSRMRSLVEWVASKLPKPRVIMNRSGEAPYLSRYYLWNKPKMADGSSPFDSLGNPKPEAIWKTGVGVYLHKFHQSDDDEGALHNHPFRWSCSLILVGGYLEYRRLHDSIVKRLIKPFRLNWIDCDDFHRVELLQKDAWSLFIVGPRTQSWGFWNPIDLSVTPWRQFLEKMRKTSRVVN